MKRVAVLVMILLQFNLAFGSDRQVVMSFLNDLKNLPVEEIPGLLSFHYRENPEIFIDTHRCEKVVRHHLIDFIFRFNDGEYGAYNLGLTKTTPAKLHFALGNYFWDKEYYRCVMDRSFPYVLEETIFYQGVESGYLIMFDVAWDD